MTEQEIYEGLIARGFSPQSAAAAIPRMRAESRLDPSINEIAPVVPGSRGGYGFNQWTGPRRRQLETFAAERGVPVSDAGVQLDFMAWEAQNTEKSAWGAINAAPDQATAERLYMERYLRPGIAHADMRGGGVTNTPGGVSNPPVDGQPNALAQTQQPERPNMLALPDNQMDPAAFMRQRNALAFAPIAYQPPNRLGRL